MSRAGDRITWRIVSWWKEHPRWAGYRIKPIHAVVSVSPIDAERLRANYPRMRDIATNTALKAGFIGGAVIYHPFRHKDFGNETLEDILEPKVDLTKGWYYSPHFHLIGFGWIKHDYEENGWIVKNIGVRGETPENHRIFELARYQLSHCGVNSRYHSITWIGQLSAHKYKAPPMPKEPPSKCPECGSFMYPVIHLGRSELDEKPEGVYTVDPPGWRFVQRSEIASSSPDRSELKSIYEDLRYG